MAGIALFSDLLKRTSTPAFSAKSLHSHGLLSATVSASVAGFSAFRLISGDGIPVAFCDAGVEWIDDSLPEIHNSGGSSNHDVLHYYAKEYPIELKPLFSAFRLKSLAITTLRSFLMFYLPLLEPRSTDDEDDDLSQDSEESSTDLVVPFKKSVKQIIRETSVTTTRRMLERLAVHYVSQRMAWKLLKDIPRSARRKAERGMPKPYFFMSVTKTTFRGQLLGAAAAWIVQVSIETYRCFFKSEEEGEELEGPEKLRLFRKKFSDATVRCFASLAFASVGAGLGALFHPSMGQWIGCAVGDFGGPLILTYCLEPLL